jgi:polar amino acid transport system substrate-binding protein
VFGLLAAACLVAAPAAAQQAIKLGAYHFPPYAMNTVDGIGGLVVDLAHAMNEAQDDYVFEIVPTSARDRYAGLADSRFDAIAFENLAWGWDGQDVVASDAYMAGAEIYVARAGEGLTQAFSDDVGSRTIAAVYGYHYGFAGYNADPAWLHRHFVVQQPLNPGTSLYYVIDGRVEIAVVPELYLQVFLREHPEFAGRFLVGERPDQTYEHTIVTRVGGPLPVAEINAILAGLKASGALDRMVASVLD